MITSKRFACVKRRHKRVFFRLITILVPLIWIFKFLVSLVQLSLLAEENKTKIMFWTFIDYYCCTCFLIPIGLFLSRDWLMGIHHEFGRLILPRISFKLAHYTQCHNQFRANICITEARLITNFENRWSVMHEDNYVYFYNNGKKQSLPREA